MGKHKKFKKQSISQIQQWMKDDLKHRELHNRLTWDSQKDIVCKWGLYTEKGKSSIKRFIKRKDNKTTWQRLPIHFYREHQQSKRELENMVLFLNGIDPAEHRAGIKYKLKDSYVPKVHVIKFCRMLKENFLNDEKQSIETRINAFICYGLNWFQSRTPKVNDWKKYDQRWGQCLLNYSDDIKDSERIFPKDELRSKNTMIRVVWIMNQFMEYLHQQYPHKYPPLVFDPISKAQYRSLLKLRRSRKLVRERGHIEAKHWKIIKKRIRQDQHLKIIELCYEFGLRRSEALALSVEKNLYTDNLLIEDQVKKIDYSTVPSTKVFKPTKTGIPRRISYDATITNISIIEIANIIETSEIISPNQLTKKWRKLMNDLGYKYDIHDCRHSYCNFIVRQVDIKQAMEYTGHKSLESINGYIQSRDELSNEKLNLTNLSLVS